MLYLVPVFPHYASANEFARWATVAGLVEHRTFETSWSVPLIGPLVDAATIDGRTYANKAPGLAFVTIPAYLAGRASLGAPSTANMRWSLYLMRLLGATVPALALGYMLARRCRDGALAASVLLFATPMFVYGAVLFSHALVAACVFGAYILIFPRAPAVASNRRDLAAGALCGLATLTDYQAAVPTVLFALFLLARRGRWQRLPPFVLGGLPFALTLAAYDRAIFGSVLSLSYAHTAFPDTAAILARGVLGLGWPTVGGLWTILASPARGLFFLAPVLAFGAVGLAARRRLDAGAAFRLALALLIVLMMAGYPANDGGWCTGPRYLLLIVPFLVEAADGNGLASGGLAAAAVAASTVLCVLPMFTFSFAPPMFGFPHADLTRPLLAAGFVTPTLGSAVTSGPLALVPLIAAALGAGALALAGGGRRALVGAIAGAAVAAAIVFVPATDTSAQRIVRAVLLETHFRPGGRLEELARTAPDPGSRAQILALTAFVDGTRAIGPDDWPYAGSAAPR